MWKVEKIVSKGDYNYCVVSPAHPNSTKHDYVLHHRVIVENDMGRLLSSNEVVQASRSNHRSGSSYIGEHRKGI